MALVPSTARQCLMDAAKLNGLVVESAEGRGSLSQESVPRAFTAPWRMERERIARAH